MTGEELDRFVHKLSRLWSDPQDHGPLGDAVRALDWRYDLRKKMQGEQGVEEIILQMFGRLARSYPRLDDIRGQHILDIACGSNSSKEPASLRIKTPFGTVPVRRQANSGFAAKFEPWFCRVLVELGASPVGVDMGDLEAEVFAHHRVDLGKMGALDFLPDASFDAVQDSRLFGSPEFTAQFWRRVDRFKIAKEVVRQEQRLLKPGGILIHSDAAGWLE